MRGYELVVLDYNYSSWSMRGGVLMRFAGVPYTETRIPYSRLEEIKRRSPSGTAPVLVHDGHTIWDSLAIAEYLAEKVTDKPFWPRAATARALARSASAEMHSSFGALRNAMCMNIRARYPGFGRTPEVDADVSRIKALWSDLRARFASDGDFLCGEFGIVDAFFAPVATRFRTYDVKLEGSCAAYAEALLAHPAVQGWLDKAREDTSRVPKYELVVG